MSRNPGDYGFLDSRLRQVVRDALRDNDCDPDLADSISSSLWNLAMDAVQKRNQAEWNPESDRAVDPA